MRDGDTVNEDVGCFESPTMDDSLSRREATRPRRVSAAAAADSDANASLQDGDVVEVHPPSETPSCTDRLGGAAGIMDRRNSGTLVVHQRHMPMQPNKFHIPRKTKEKRALFQEVSPESREFEDMMNILTSSYFDTGSAGCFTYSKPRLVHSELLEKEFVEKRREMKLDGRTDKELEESYGFLLVDTVKLPLLCENGLCVGQSWITVLGNPSKGVYLSRYSDLLQVNPFNPGATGEMIIFKVMKGKIKSIYENMKNLLDPTPRFDSHILKNASKVTSLTSYRAFEFTQQYFYEYSFDELRQRPRQVCPYAVVSFQFKGKEPPLLRLNSQSSEGSKERAQFTVWTGDLVQGDRVLFQISLRSFSPPLLPHRLPEKLKIGCVMRLDQVTKLLPSGLFSYNRYKSSQEVVENGFCCSLLEVTDRNRATTSVTKLLRELEMERVVLVTPLTERGFLFLLSSVQMATPAEREEDWKRGLQALFVFPKTRDVSNFKSKYASSSHDALESLISAATVMPRLRLFIPALHHALVKARATPSPELSAGVERQAREYLIGLKDGKARQYPMGEYDSRDDDQERPSIAPKRHKVNIDSYLRSYLYSPSFYLLSVARAKQMMETHCGPEEPQQGSPRSGFGNLRESTGKEVTGNTRDRQTNTKKMQQLIDLVLTCKRNAENEVRREEGGERGLRAQGRKRRLEQQTAARALKFLKATQGAGGHDKIPVHGSQVPAAPGSLRSVISSVGLRDVDVREDGSELASKLLSLLTGLQRAARGKEGQESCPFDKLATKLGLPTNCDIDLRKQQDLEEQTAGSVSSLEGFSPSSHSGEMNHHGAVGRRGAGGYEEGEDEWEIPWVLIPITGLSSERYSQRERNIPRDPRFQHLTTGTNITTTTKPPRMSPTSSPEPSPPSSPSQYTSPKPRPSTCPSQCPSPDPSPPHSPVQCPSPEPGSPFFLSQCPPSEHSLLPSPSHCPSPQSSPPQHTAPQLSPPPSPLHGQSLEPMECNPPDKANSAANEKCLAPKASREITGMSKHIQEKPQVKEPSIPRAPKKRMSSSLPTSKQGKEYAQGEMVEVKEEDVIIVEGGQESQPVKNWGRRESWKQREDKVRENKPDKEEVVDMIQEVASEKEPKSDVTELVGGSLSSPPTTSPPAHPLDNINHIVDKHLSNISSEIQRLLQEESIQYTFPQSPHSTSNTETSIPQHTLPHMLTSHFSHYVSYYNPCPPVQDYVGSLQDSINSMLRAECGDSWRSHSADTVLASSVDAFVASIRAANTTSSRVDEASVVSCAELTAADASASISQTSAPSNGAQVWQQDAKTRLFPDAANSRNSPASNVTLSAPTPASGAVHNPTDTTDLHPPYGKLPHSHWNPRQSHMSEINRTVGQDSCSAMADVDGESGLAGSSSDLTIPGSSSVSQPLSEPELGSSLPTPAPPATDLNSLIDQLDPEVFNSLMNIIKDVKKKSVHFYLLCTEPRDQVFEEVKEHLLKQGFVEQIPVSFLNQENGSSRLLVIVKNKDIAGHIHKIPSLVSLKRRSSVLFVGIDTLDDIRNNSYNELFVSGGCIISDELILSPDCITHGQLAELLMLLEQHSSEETIWKWKVHCKTHKKLKEQARFRRDAANMLDILSAYQKRQIVEFLPYHHCDMTNHQSPNLQCLMELQARYTQYRHTIFLTEHSFEKSPAYINSGIIIVGIKEILNSFTRLVGYHDIKDKRLMRDTLLGTKSLGRQLSHGDSMSGTEHSPSIFPEHIPYLSSIEQPQHVLQQTGSGLPSHPHLSDQLVPDGSSKDGMPQPSDRDFEVLRLAISHLRAERQAQLQQQQGSAAAAEFNINSPKSFLSSLAHGHTTSPLDEGGPTESIQHTTGRQTMEATLQWINSALQPELREAERRKDRESPAEGQRTGRSLAGEEEDSPDGTAVRVLELSAGKHCLNKHDTSTLSSNQNTAAVTGPGDQKQITDAEREIAAQHSGAHSTTTSCPVDDNGPGDIPSGQDWPVTREEALPESGTKATGNVPMVTGQKDNPKPAPPRVQQIHQPSQHLHFNKQQQQFKSNLSHQQPLPHHQQQHRGNSLLQTPLLPQLPAQSFSAAPLLRPLTAVGRARSLLGPTPVWSGGLGPAGSPAMVWGFPQAVSGPGLLRVYHNPAGQGSNRFRGVQRGGFNGL